MSGEGWGKGKDRHVVSVSLQDKEAHYTARGTKAELTLSCLVVSDGLRTVSA